MHKLALLMEDIARASVSAVVGLFMLGVAIVIGIIVLVTIMTVLKMAINDISEFFQENSKEKMMNKAILMGRLTRDPEIRYSNGPEQTAVGRFTLAVDRRGQRQGNQQNADFIPCVAFGKKAEFVEKYTHKGTKVIVEGEIRTGSYTNREGRKVYTTEIYVSDIEFAESKAAAEQNQNRNDDQYGMTGDDGFMNIPDGEELPPFN